MNGRNFEVFFSWLHLVEMHSFCISSESFMIGFVLDHVKYFLIFQSSAKLDHYFPQTRRGLDCLFMINVGDWKNYILCKFWRLYISTYVYTYVYISNNHQMNVQSIKGSIIYTGLLTFQYTRETTSMCHTEKYV